MKSEIDPRLKAQIDEAGDEGEVEAVVLLGDQGSSMEPASEHGAGGPLIDRVSKQVDQQPTNVRYMPQLGALYVKGSGKLVRELLQQDEVVSASAKDVEITTPGTRDLAP